jgi:hypothetical protein
MNSKKISVLKLKGPIQNKISKFPLRNTQVKIVLLIIEKIQQNKENFLIQSWDKSQKNKKKTLKMRMGQSKSLILIQ